MALSCVGGPQQNTEQSKEEVTPFSGSLVELGHLISSAFGLGFIPLIADGRLWDFSASVNFYNI